MRTLAPADRFEILELARRANQLLDAGEATQWAGCFTPDATFVREPGPTTRSEGMAAVDARGADALVEHAASHAEGPTYRHWSENHLLTLRGDGVVETVSYLLMYRLDPAPARVISSIARDEIIRTAAGWRFRSRLVQLDT
jgi:hypothetical protein